jgi:predicted MPP superfamily phosphohydrolase
MLIYLFIALLLVILFVDTVDPGPSKTISLFWAFSEIKKNKIRIMSEKKYIFFKSVPVFFISYNYSSFLRCF